MFVVSVNKKLSVLCFQLCTVIIMDEDDFDFEYDFAKAAQNQSERWTEENWEKEMEKHPMFMSKEPKPGEESALVEAFSQLKYDPEFNSPYKLMESYKTDGNVNYQNKKYKWAIDSYTEGIRIATTEMANQQLCISIEEKEKIRKLLSILYNNRASAHFYLENYRTSGLEATRAMLIDPENFKAIIRVAKCYFSLRKYFKCIDFCKKCLDEDYQVKLSENVITELKILMKRATAEKKVLDRNERRLKNELEKNFAKEKEIERAVMVKRKIRIKGSLFAAPLPPGTNHVHFDPEDNQTLVWPVTFLYPHYSVSDFIRRFSENETFAQHLEVMFENPPDWDHKRIFTLDKLRIFYKSEPNENFVRFNSNHQLREILTRPDFVATDGVLLFFIGLEDEM